MWWGKQLPVIDAEAIGFPEAAYYIIGDCKHRIAFPLQPWGRGWVLTGVGNYLFPTQTLPRQEEERHGSCYASQELE
jgi:hypothetical protein